MAKKNWWLYVVLVWFISGICSLLIIIRPCDQARFFIIHIKRNHSIKHFLEIICWNSMKTVLSLSNVECHKAQKTFQI